MKSNHIEVTALNAKEQVIEADLSALKGLGSSAVKLNRTSRGAVSFQHFRDTPLTFGFKVFRIDFESGRWALCCTEAGQDKAFSIDAAEACESRNPDLETPVLFGESGSLLSLDIEPSRSSIN
ncbi:MAG: hypothetical protein WKF37_07355 [Bryobacteraceae bacterium]